MRLSGLKLMGGFLLAAVLSVPAWAANSALPGTLNYVEGQASIGTQTLQAKSVGTVDLQAGETLTTENGKAEILLTPGVFLRLGNDSAATLVSPNLTNTEVALNSGQAMVEVAEIHKDNLLRIQQDGATTQLLKAGLYGFDASSGAVRVFKGEARVQDGDNTVKVKGGRELDLKSTEKLKAVKFDKKANEQSDLYRFSNLRSEYLAEANADAARVYVAGGPGWYGPGWYWNPFFTAYTWIPGSGILYSPFGWGFYSPLWVGYAPYYRPYYYPGYGYVAGARPNHAPNAVSAARPMHQPDFRGVGPSRAPAPASHFGVMGGGFRGGMAGAFTVQQSIAEN